MKTPIEQFIRKLTEQNKTRFFMPGHKGNWQESLLHAAFPYDITEIKGADTLYSAEGIIGESEEAASRLFGSKATLYSTQGSTLCIQTMLMLVSKRGKKIIAGRNAHNSFVNACILLGIEPVWVLPEQVDHYGVCGLLTAKQIQSALFQHPDAAAVYLTSPDYLGNTVNLEEINKICREFGTLLLCDHAHGAYLKFTDSGNHPMEQGADLCCDSAHKTLPVLTGGAYLHLGKESVFSKREAKAAMSMFGSTSPSYLTLLSLDLCNRYLFEQAKQDFADFKMKLLDLKRVLTQNGFVLLDNPIDFAKLTFDANQIGYTGTALAEHFSEYGIEAEYANEHYLVYMLSPFNTEQDYQRLIQAAARLELRSKIAETVCSYEIPERVMLPVEAFKQESEWVAVENSVGRIAAQTVSSCPPGTAVIVPGEKITGFVKNICEKGGNFQLKVLK